MGSHYQLHLEHLSWPISVLKFNGAISALQNGDDLVATLRDPDIVTNIRQLLGCRAGFRYEVQQTDSGYRIQIVKGDSDH